MFNKEQVKHIANLSMLELEEKELELYAEQFEQIISYFKKLDELDTEGVEELLKPSFLENITREDKAVEGLNKEEALMNVPDRSGNLIKVPPVV